MYVGQARHSEQLFPGQVVVDLPGNVALEYAHDLFFGLALNSAASNVGLGRWVARHAAQHDAPECVIGLTVTSSVQPMTVTLPEEASSGDTPQSLAQVASLRSLDGLSPAAMRRSAAVS